LFIKLIKTAILASFIVFTYLFKSSCYIYIFP